MDVRDSGAPLRRPDPAPGRPAGAGRRRRFVDRRAAAEAALPPRTNALTTKDTKRTKEKRRRSGEVPSRLSTVGAASPPRTNALTTKDTKCTKEKARRSGEDLPRSVYCRSGVPAANKCIDHEGHEVHEGKGETERRRPAEACLP